MTTIIIIQAIKLQSFGLDLQLSVDGKDEFNANIFPLAFMG